MATQYVRSYCQTAYFPFPRYVNYQVQSTKNHTINKEPIFVSWNFPPEGCIKINTDGSFMPYSGLGGYGGVVRDDKGNWLGGFYGRLSVKGSSSLTAELWAIHGGLNVAKHYNLKKVILETDSSAAIMLLTVGGNNTAETHPDRAVIEECRCLISELGITLVHTLRQGNSCADHLTKLGRMQTEDFVIIHRPSYALQQLLLADMSHVACARYPKYVT